MQHTLAKKNIYFHRLPLLSWLLLPLVILWLSVSYIIGVNKGVAWDERAQGSNQAPLYMYEEVPVAPFEWKGTGLVTLWFDDAWYSQYSVAFPIMEKYGFKGALAVPTGLVNFKEYMTWPQIQKMQHSGWEIQSHSINHICDEKKLDNETILTEMKDSFEEIRAHNLVVETYVAPCGIVNDEVKKIAKEYYLSMRTTDEGVNNLPVIDPYHLTILAITDQTTIDDVNFWLNKAEQEKKWLIIVFHPLGEDSSAYGATPQFFKNILSAIETSRLPVVVPSQALQVVK